MRRNTLASCRFEGSKSQIELPLWRIGLKRSFHRGRLVQGTSRSFRRFLAAAMYHRQVGGT